MGSVSFQVNGRRYSLGCDPGQEERLQRLGERLAARVKDLADQLGQVGDQKLLLMASITLMDEYDELSGNMEARAEALVSEIQKDAASSVKAASKAQTDATKALDAMADKVERVLESLPEVEG